MDKSPGLVLKSLPKGSILLVDEERRKRKFEQLSSLVSRPSSALEHMSAFLPKMAAANDAMDAKLASNPQEFNVEDISNTDGPVIEMNLALVEMDDDIDEGLSSDDESSCSSDDDLAQNRSNDRTSEAGSCDALEENSSTETHLRFTRNGRSLLQERPLITVLDLPGEEQDVDKGQNVDTDDNSSKEEND